MSGEEPSRPPPLGNVGSSSSYNRPDGALHITAAEVRSVRESDFASTHFTPERYVKKEFIGFTTDQVEAHLHSLEEKSDLSVRLLQKNVYDHHTEFISSSKEIQNLEEDMNILRSLVSEYTSHLQTLRGVSFNLQSKSLIARKEKAPEKKVVSTLKGVRELVAQLDMLTYEKEFKEAVQVLGKAEKSLSRTKVAGSAAVDEIKPKILDRKNRLVKELLAELCYSSLQASELDERVFLLGKLGVSREAMNTFLDSRSTHLSQEVEKITSAKHRITDDVCKHIDTLSNVVFTFLRTVCIDVNRCFSDPSLKSGLLVWILRELRWYGELFGELVFSKNDLSLVAPCMEIAISYCQTLEPYGVHVQFHLSKMFQKELQKIFSTLQENIIGSLSESLDVEDWSKQHFSYAQPGDSPLMMKPTSSCETLGVLLKDFCTHAALVLSKETTSVISSFLEKIIKIYLQRLGNEITTTHSLVDAQRIAILCDGEIVVQGTIPQLMELLCHRDDTFRIHIEKHVLSEVQCIQLENREKFCKDVSQKVVFHHDRIHWDAIDYSTIPPIDSSAKPSSKFQKLQKYLDELGIQLNGEVGPKLSSSLMGDISLRIARSFSCDGRYTGESLSSIKDETCLFSQGGLHQFIIDLRCFNYGVDRYSIPKVSEYVNDLIDRVTLYYCTYTRTDPNDVLKDESFYSRAIGQTKKSGKSSSIGKSSSSSSGKSSSGGGGSKGKRTRRKKKQSKPPK